MLAMVREEHFDRAMAAHVRRNDSAAFRAAIGRLDVMPVQREGVSLVYLQGLPADVSLVEGEVKKMSKPQTSSQVMTDKIVAAANAVETPKRKRAPRKPASGCAGLSELLVIGQSLTDEQIALETAREAACELGNVDAMRAVGIVNVLDHAINGKAKKRAAGDAMNSKTSESAPVKSPCAFAGCQKLARPGSYYRGFCDKHEVVDRRARIDAGSMVKCSVDDCYYEAKKGELCTKHARQAAL